MIVDSYSPNTPPFAEPLALALAETGGGLVEQQQPGPGGDGPGELDHPLVLQRQRGGVPAAQRGHAQAGQGLFGLLPGLSELAAEQTGCDAGPVRGQAGDRHVVQHGAAADQVHRLEGPADTEAEALLRRQPGHVGAVEQDPAAGGRHAAADDAE
jgi:hypothetical protein